MAGFQFPSLIPKVAPTLAGGLVLPPPGQPGVAVTPAAGVHLDIHKLVEDELKRATGTGALDGKTMAVLSVTTDRGVNLAVAHRETVETGLFRGQWTTELWVGKHFDKAPPAGGVQIIFAR